MVEVHASLEEEPLEEATQLVVTDGGDERCPMTEDTGQGSSHVVLPTALTDPELAGGSYAVDTRVEAKQHLPECHDIESAALRGSELEVDRHLSYPPMRQADRDAATTASQFSASTASRGAIQLPPTASTDPRER